MIEEKKGFSKVDLTYSLVILIILFGLLYLLFLANTSGYIKRKENELANINVRMHIMCQDYDEYYKVAENNLADSTTSDIEKRIILSDINMISQKYTVLFLEKHKTLSKIAEHSDTDKSKDEIYASMLEEEKCPAIVNTKSFQAIKEVINL